VLFRNENLNEEMGDIFGFADALFLQEFVRVFYRGMRVQR